MTRRQIAVIGSGVTGLTAAYLLARATTSPCSRPTTGWAGTRTPTRCLAADGAELGVDSGFIVHNERTYPTADRLFAELGVSTQESEMSHVRALRRAAVWSTRARAAWAGCSPECAGAAAARTCACSARSSASTARRVSADRRPATRIDLTLGEFLAADGYSRYFTAHFMLPFVAAVWSCAPGTRAGLPGALPVHVPGQPRDAVGDRLAAVADRDRRLAAATWSGSPSSSRRCGPRRRCAACAGTAAGRRSATSRLRRAAVRRGRRRHPPGPGARACSPTPPAQSARCSARSATPATRPCCTPTPRCCPPARGPGRRGTT